jgi:hypothetical protein
MTFIELSKAIEELLPGAQLGEDMEGQIVIYTDMMVDPDACGSQVWQLVPYVEQEDSINAV